MCFAPGDCWRLAFRAFRGISVTTWRRSWEVSGPMRMRETTQRGMCFSKISPSGGSEGKEITQPFEGLCSFRNGNHMPHSRADAYSPVCRMCVQSLIYHPRLLRTELGNKSGAVLLDLHCTVLSNASHATLFALNTHDHERNNPSPTLSGMASLLERMNVDTTPSVGPVRSKTRRAASAPYSRPPKGDINSPWKHDMYQQGSESGKSLSDRLGAPQKDTPPKMNFGSAVKALKEATGSTSDKELSIRGASTRGNVVEVTGLVKGTTAEDVEAIFKRCGPIMQSSVKQTHGTADVTVRLTFKQEKDAREAVRVFDQQVADGRTLGVRVIGGVNASLSGRLSMSVVDGSVDVLMETDTDGGSKMRSDDIISRDPEAAARAHILIAPPGADPKDYIPSSSSSRGRGRGRRRPAAGGGR